MCLEPPRDGEVAARRADGGAVSRATSKRTVAQARKLRTAMTMPEVLVWRELRKRPEGFRFRRQHPVGEFILDFYCPQAKLGIEVDGIAHDVGDRPLLDEARDRWLAEQGIAVMRVRASDVLNSLDDVIEGIVASCRRF